LNRKAGLWKAGRKSRLYRRDLTGQKNRGRAYLFIGGSRRQRQKERPGMARQRKMLAAMMIMVLLTLLYYGLLRLPVARPPLQSAESAGGDPAGQASESSYLRFLQQILGHEIPGLEPPAASGSDQFYRALSKVLHSLTGIDPYDPCSVLDLELGVGARVSLPVTIPPSSTAPGGKPDSQPGSQGPEEAPWGGSAYPFPLPGYGEPPILLYHTHASEAFTAGSSIVTAGEELARLLGEIYGLQVLYHRGVYDIPRRSAYGKARPVIEKILAENSGIQLVIDLHRDGVPRAKTTATLEGKDMGAILLVHGTRNPASEKTLEFVMRLQYELEAVAPGLSRGILQQDFVYNQDLHPYAILIEVGGHENSIDEVLLSLPYLAEALARTYYLFFIED